MVVYRLIRCVLHTITQDLQHINVARILLYILLDVGLYINCPSVKRIGLQMYINISLDSTHYTV